MSAKKWVFVGVFTLFISSLAMADPPAEHPATGAPLVVDCLRGTPDAIDGDLSDWNLAAMTPAVLDVEEQLYMGNASWTDVSDCGGQFYMLWDDEYLYMAVVVTDDSLSMNKTGGDIWNADAIEIFFATTNAVAGDAEHYQYGFNANEQTWNWCNMDSGGQSAIDYLQVAATETADGYICEAAIEYGQMLSLDWSVGSEIGFHPVIDDTDNGDREIQMTWTSREAHDQSLGFGYLVLSEDRAIAKELARDPSPANEATDVPRDTDLGWNAGAYAVAHDVYIGTSFDDVNDGTTPDSAGQSETTYDPGLLDYGQTYYWRIDEVNGAPDNTVHKGSVWSFTVEPLGVPIENIVVTTNTTNDGISVPEKTIDGSGLNENDEHSTAAPDMWLGVPSGADPAYIQYDFDKVYKLHELLVWNYNVQFELVLGFGFKDVTVEYTENGADWVVLSDVVFAQATARADYAANTAVALNGVAGSGLRLTANTGYGPMGQFGLSEVRILAIPVQAREPQPADGATDVLADAALSWRAGRGAAVHDVLLGTDAEALALVASVTEATYVPGDLEFGITYYWQINEVNEAEEISVWEGNVWSFVTQEFAVIDDMESYDDDENRIYDTWLDGFVNGTGS
ncbi:MAG: sugar-binding protein, partial [Planctomycetota bacterium]